MLLPAERQDTRPPHPHPVLLSSLWFLLAKPDQSHRVNILHTLPSLDTEHGKQAHSVSMGQMESPSQSPKVTSRLQGSPGDVLVLLTGIACLLNSLWFRSQQQS